MFEKLDVIIQLILGAFLICISLFIVSNFQKQKSERISQQQEIVQVHTRANVRSCPGINGCQVIDVISIGDRIPILGRVEGEMVDDNNNEWIEFRSNNKKAYVWSGLVSKLASETPNSEVTRQLKSTKLPTATKVPAATLTPTTTNTPIMLFSPSQCTYVRSDPSISSRIIGRVSMIDDILASDMVNGDEVRGNKQWIKLKYNGRNGYIPQSYMTQYSQTQSDLGITPSDLSPSFTCNRAKKCEYISTCVEAFFQYINCGAEKRDGNNDGIPCDERCRCRQY